MKKEAFVLLRTETISIKKGEMTCDIEHKKNKPIFPQAAEREYLEKLETHMNSNNIMAVDLTGNEEILEDIIGSDPVKNVATVLLNLQHEDPSYPLFDNLFPCEKITVSGVITWEQSSEVSDGVYTATYKKTIELNDNETNYMRSIIPPNRNGRCGDCHQDIEVLFSSDGNKVSTSHCYMKKKGSERYPTKINSTTNECEIDLDTAVQIIEDAGEKRITLYDKARIKIVEGRNTIMKTVNLNTLSGGYKKKLGIGVISAYHSPQYTAVYTWDGKNMKQVTHTIYDSEDGMLNIKYMSNKGYQSSITDKDVVHYAMRICPLNDPIGRKVALNLCIPPAIEIYTHIVEPIEDCNPDLQTIHAVFFDSEGKRIGYVKNDRVIGQDAFHIFAMDDKKCIVDETNSTILEWFFQNTCPTFKSEAFRPGNKVEFTVLHRNRQIDWSGIITESILQKLNGESTDIQERTTKPLSERRIKRSDYINWDTYFMGVAKLSAMRSKDPNTQVGAVIVSSDHRILSVGYNGFPNGCSDDKFSWAREAEHVCDTKYPYVVHAELNAILNCKSMDALKGASLYTTLFPCNECAKAIIQSGIKTIYYDSDKYNESDESIAARRMLDAANVTYSACTAADITISI